LADPSAYATTVLADSPAGFWRLDSSGGTEPDATANANTATISPQVVTGQFGALAAETPNRAMRFDGLLNSARLEIPDSPSLAVSPTGSTIEGWANPSVPQARSPLGQVFVSIGRGA
jgi:hypothetical protein